MVALLLVWISLGGFRCFGFRYLAHASQIDDARRDGAKLPLVGGCNKGFCSRQCPTLLLREEPQSHFRHDAQSCDTNPEDVSREKFGGDECIGKSETVITSAN